MTKQDLLRKLGSRKFWAMVAGLVTSLTVLFGLGDDTTVKVVGVITAFGSIAIYILGEAYVDGKREEGDTFIDADVVNMTDTKELGK